METTHTRNAVDSYCFVNQTMVYMQLPYIVQMRTTILELLGPVGTELNSPARDYTSVQSETQHSHRLQRRWHDNIVFQPQQPGGTWNQQKAKASSPNCTSIRCNDTRQAHDLLQPQG